MPETSVNQPHKPVVYIASPYTRGDPAINTHAHCRLWDRLMSDGRVWPVAPLWSHFQHTVFPRAYPDWIAYDLALIPRYDACLRADANHDALGYAESRSSGADGEVAEFRRLGKPVFFSVDDLYAWAATVSPTADVARLAAENAGLRQERDSLKSQRDEAIAGKCVGFLSGFTCGDDGAYCSEACRLRAALRVARSTLDYIATQYDHDGSAHKYGTACRRCDATEAVEAIDAALAPTKEQP